MTEWDGPVIADGRTELQKFALWFHQDWKLFYPDFQEGARMYLESVPPKRKAVLRKELSKFLNSQIFASDKALHNAWIRLGAQACPPGFDKEALQALLSGEMK